MPWSADLHVEIWVDGVRNQKGKGRINLRKRRKVILKEQTIYVSLLGQNSLRRNVVTLTSHHLTPINHDVTDSCLMCPLVAMIRMSVADPGLLWCCQETLAIYSPCSVFFFSSWGVGCYILKLIRVISGKLYSMHRFFL